MPVEDEHQWLKTANNMLFSSTICISTFYFFSSNFHSRFLLFLHLLSSKKTNVKIEKHMTCHVVREVVKKWILLYHFPILIYLLKLYKKVHIVKPLTLKGIWFDGIQIENLWI